jgi:hypothetical protein
MNTATEYDEFLSMNIHRGFRKMYLEILNDLPATVYESSDSSSRFYITGHSLGGVLSCLLAASLKRNGVHIDGVTTFGMPKFTDKKGSILLAKLPIVRVQHLLDPVGIDFIVGPAANEFCHPIGKEIFLHSTPSTESSEFVKNLFSEFDRKGNRLDEDAEDHFITLNKQASILNNITGTQFETEIYVTNALKIHLKYHSMKKYLEIIKKKHDEYRLKREMCF